MATKTTPVRHAAQKQSKEGEVCKTAASNPYLCTGSIRGGVPIFRLIHDEFPSNVEQRLVVIVV
jgi:hypothetical protein